MKQHKTARHFTALALAALLLAALLAGCGGTPEAPSTSAPGSATGTEAITNETAPATAAPSAADTATSESSASTATPEPSTAAGNTAPTPGSTAAGNNTPAAKPGTTEDATELFRGVQAILASGTFTLRGRSNSTLPGASAGLSPLIMVHDQDKSATETTVNMSKLLSSSGATALQATMLSAALGNTARLLVTKDQELFVFPDRKVYLNLTGAMNNVPSTGNLPSAGTVTTSKEKRGGTEYLCGTAKDKYGITWKLFFLNGDFKRMEKIEAGKDTIITEVDSLSAAAEQKYLSTSGMLPFDLSAISAIL